MPHISVTAAESPDRPAIVMAGSGEVVSYSQLDRRSNQIAHLLRGLGLRTGEHIGFMLENCREFVELMQGALRCGLVFTPIGTHLRRDEVRYILDNCNARLFIGSAALAEVAGELLGELPAVEHYYMAHGVRPGFASWEEALAGQPDTPIADQAAGVPMLYSSGTTGQPKGVLSSAPNEDLYSDSPMLASLTGLFGFDRDTRYLSPAPLYHAAPLHYNNMVLALGGCSVIMERFDAESALRLIEERRITHSQWVPIMFARMLKLEEALRMRYDCGSLEVAIHAAAPCPVEVKRRMIEWWGPVIFEYYAGSEGSGMTMIDSATWLQRQGSVGRAVIGELRILGERGEELPPGQVGTVYFANGPRFEYYGEPEKTARAYSEQGWSTLGDVGYADQDGFLYLTDRKHFTIISGGVNIYPQEVENLLIGHPKVADVAVFGVPNPEYGEEVKAVVQPLDWADASERTAAELIGWCRERLSHVKVPRSVDFMAQLPRMENGKLYKRRLAERYRAAPARRGQAGGSPAAGAGSRGRRKGG